MISWKEVVSNLPNDFVWLGYDTSRSHQMIDTQFGITIMGGREVSRPYRNVGFGRFDAVFYVFFFDSIHDSATMHNLFPEIFHCTKAPLTGILWYNK